MLDCEPSEKEEYPSEMDSGGIAAPRLGVHVLERERVVTGGRVKTGCIRTENRESQFRYKIIGGILTRTRGIFSFGLKCHVLQALAFQEAVLCANHMLISELEGAQGRSDGWLRFNDARLVGGLVVSFEALENWLWRMHGQVLAPFHTNAGRSFNHGPNRTALNMAATQHLHGCQKCSCKS